MFLDWLSDYIGLYLHQIFVECTIVFFATLLLEGIVYIAVKIYKTRKSSPSEKG